MNTDMKLYQSIGSLALATGALLLIPLIAMQFTDEVVWTLADFLVMGILIFGTGFFYLLVTRILAPRLGDNMIYRVAVAFGLGSGLFLIWANLAVGLVGSEDNPANVMYFGVIFVGLIGAGIARFRPRGMAYTMFAMAITQALIAVIILIGGMYPVPPSSVMEIFSVNGMYITLFTVTGLLFRHAGEQEVSEAEEG